MSAADSPAPEDLRQKIEREIDVVDWTPLRLHAKRDALFFVDGRLDVGDVAYAIATNRGALVRHWLAENFLRRPSENEREALEKTGESERFRFVIVQPYVLAQRQAGSA
jgi:hypothetical protein